MIIIEHEPSVSQTSVKVMGSNETLVRFHEVWQTKLWPNWRQFVGKNERLDRELQWLKDSETTGFMVYANNKATATALDAAIADAETRMTVIK